MVQGRLADEKDARVCHFELWNVSQMLNGWQVRFTSLAEAQPVGPARANEQAFARFSRIPEYVDVQTENLREGLRRAPTARRRSSSRW